MPESLTSEDQFITPDKLEADAVVPQCLDNQFVSDRIYRFMTEQRANYSDQRVHDMREQETRNEFIRSLVYASQVIVNRAYLKNNANVFNFFLPDSPDLKAAAALVRGKVIIPYLFQEKSLGEGVNFNVRQEGDGAIAALLNTLGTNPKCLRLAAEDAANERATGLVALTFRNYLTRFKLYDENQRNALAAELFADPRVLQDGDAWQRFDRQLEAVAEFAWRYGRAVPRNEVYRQFITAPDGDIALGDFRAPNEDNPFIFEVKKLIDLAYNTTIPDLMKRYTFTPTELPTRAVLQDELTLASASEDWMRCVPSAEVLDWMRRHFMARTQAAMTLPLLRRLSLADVLEVRGFPEWAEFRDKQTGILTNPFDLPQRLPGYSLAFDKLQAELSKWYATKYQDGKTLERYANFVTFLLQIGGKYICATCIPRGEELMHVAADALLDKAIEMVPKRATGVVAKLLVGVYNVDRRRLDSDRSYTIEIMRSGQELMQDEIRDLVERLTDRDKDIRVNLGRFADQGKNEAA